MRGGLLRAVGGLRYQLELLFRALIYLFEVHARKQLSTACGQMGVVGREVCQSGVVKSEMLAATEALQ